MPAALACVMQAAGHFLSNASQCACPSSRYATYPQAYPSRLHKLCGQPAKKRLPLRKN
jgi:hypothetical protein